jgi:hypothetical protein
MSLKSQKDNMKAVFSLVSIDLGYIFGERESGPRRRTNVALKRSRHLLTRLAGRPTCPNGAKKEFLTKSAAFLRALGKDLGFIDMNVSTNPSGIAVSGEVSLYGMWSEGNGLFFQINQPLSMQHGSFLFRHITHMKDYRGGPSSAHKRRVEPFATFVNASGRAADVPNRWLPCYIFEDADYQRLMETLLDLKEPGGVNKNAA